VSNCKKLTFGFGFSDSELLHRSDHFSSYCGVILPGKRVEGSRNHSERFTMSKYTVLVLGDPADAQLAMLEPLRPEANIVVCNSAAECEKAAPDAVAVFNWSGALTLLRQAFGMCPHLKWIHSRSAGLERTLFPELVESDVILTNGTGVFSASLGEFALAAILYFAKDLRRMLRNQMAGVWEPFDVLPVAGDTVGIVGYGDIGRAVAERVHAMGMKVLALKRQVNRQDAATDLADEIYSPDRRLEMIPHCDYIVSAAPLTPETRGLLAEPELAAMKPNAVVINVGRGPVIKEEALVKTLSEGRIKGAALDVFDEEPLPAGHPFYTLENVLLSPHCADHTPDWLDNAMLFFVEQFERFRKNEPLKNVVEKKLGY
jgi:phosphoglycerate dehydrogenase-like enzyme